MVRKATVLAALLAPLLISAKPPAMPMVEGWTDISAGTTCGLRQDGLFMTTQGAKVLLGVAGVTQTQSMVRDIRIGDQDFTFAFIPAKSGVIAVLDDDALERLIDDGRVRADWMPAGPAQARGVKAAIVGLDQCGEVMADKRKKQEAMRRGMLAFVGALGEGMASAPPPPAPSYGASGFGAPAGAAAPIGRPTMLCMAKGEWTSGMNRNCVYSCAGSEAVQTVSVGRICPPTIRR